MFKFNLRQAYHVFTLDRVITVIIKQVSRRTARMGWSSCPNMVGAVETKILTDVFVTGAVFARRLQGPGAVVFAAKGAEQRGCDDIRYHPIQTRGRSQPGIRRSPVQS